MMENVDEIRSELGVVEKEIDELEEKLRELRTTRLNLDGKLRSQFIGIVEYDNYDYSEEVHERYAIWYGYSIKAEVLKNLEAFSENCEDVTRTEIYEAGPDDFSTFDQMASLYKAEHELYSIHFRGMDDIASLRQRLYEARQRIADKLSDRFPTRLLLGSNYNYFDNRWALYEEICGEEDQNDCEG